IEVIHADGTLGWPAAAPYEGIVVTAGGPSVPEALKRQLAIGGRLVIPVGVSRSRQVLTRLTRTAEDSYKEEPLSDVRFVPLVGEQGWVEDEPSPGTASSARWPPGSTSTADMIAMAAEPLTDPDAPDID